MFPEARKSSRSLSAASKLCYSDSTPGSGEKLVVYGAATLTTNG
jgi:hypothetical protein